MRREKQADIRIDDFHLRQDGFVQSYKGTWKEQGMMAPAWLDTVEPGHFPPGLFLRNAYELSSTYERALGGPPRGAHQDEIGAELAAKLRERMKSEMRAAGWQVVAHTKEGREIWQYKPVHVPAEISDISAAQNCNEYSNTRGTRSPTCQLHLRGLQNANHTATVSWAIATLLQQ